nr:hypothetical protein [Propionibacterium sp.]
MAATTQLLVSPAPTGADADAAVPTPLAPPAAEPDPTLLVRTVRADRHDDPRGSLVCADFAGLDFAAVRAFVVTGAAGAVRGGHAHRRGRQLMMLAAGQVLLDVVVDGVHRRLHLPRDARAVLVEPGVWARQTYLGEGSVLTVLCDTPYDPDDYVTDCPLPALPGLDATDPGTNP